MLWETEKLLVTSNFSFSHSVFYRSQQQTCNKQGLFGKGLIPQQQINIQYSKTTIAESLSGTMKSSATHNTWKIEWA